MKTITDKHVDAAYLQAASLDPGKIAQRVGVTTKTLHRWNKEKLYLDLVEEKKKVITGQIAERIVTGARLGVTALLSVLSDKDATVTQKISAARVLLPAGVVERVLREALAKPENPLSGLSEVELDEKIESLYGNLGYGQEN